MASSGSVNVIALKNHLEEIVHESGGHPLDEGYQQGRLIVDIALSDGNPEFSLVEQTKFGSEYATVARWIDSETFRHDINPASQASLERRVNALAEKALKALDNKETIVFGAGREKGPERHHVRNSGAMLPLGKNSSLHRADCRGRNKGSCYWNGRP